MRNLSNKLSNRSLWASVTAAVVLGGLGALPAHATPGGQAARPGPSVSPLVLQAMQRDFHLTAAQVRDRVGAEDAANRAATLVRGRVGDRAWSPGVRTPGTTASTSR